MSYADHCPEERLEAAVKGGNQDPAKVIRMHKQTPKCLSPIGSGTVDVNLTSIQMHVQSGCHLTLFSCFHGMPMPTPIPIHTLAKLVMCKSHFKGSYC